MSSSASAPSRSKEEGEDEDEDEDDDRFFEVAHHLTCMAYDRFREQRCYELSGVVASAFQVYVVFCVTLPAFRRSSIRGVNVRFSDLDTMARRVKGSLQQHMLQFHSTTREYWGYVARTIKEADAETSAMLKNVTLFFEDASHVSYELGKDDIRDEDAVIILRTCTERSTESMTEEESAVYQPLMNNAFRFVIRKRNDASLLFERVDDVAAMAAEMTLLSLQHSPEAAVADPQFRKRIGRLPGAPYSRYKNAIAL